MKSYSILYLNRKCQWTNIYESGRNLKRFNTVDEAKSHVDTLRKDKSHEINLVQHVCIAQYDGNQLIKVVERY